MLKLLKTTGGRAAAETSHGPLRPPAKIDSHFALPRRIGSAGKISGGDRALVCKATLVVVW
jgi:hypothetical protein